MLFLVGALSVVIATKGASAVSDVSQPILLIAACIALILSYIFNAREKRILYIGIKKSVSQIMPAVPILLLIATVSATWMLGGIVPSLIYYGLSFLKPATFLFLTCAICSIISVLTGSSWTTCATIGIAFIGIGRVMGYELGWVAGAVISGAYFGDKVSPLSDTTVLASSSAGVKLFEHIKYLMITTMPAIGIALLVFLIVGLTHVHNYTNQDIELVNSLNSTFNISPWFMIVPLITCAMIAFRINVLITLGMSTIIGVVCMMTFQHDVFLSVTGLTNPDILTSLISIPKLLFFATSMETGDKMLNGLVATGGIVGMWNTLYLILAAMIFGGVMLGTGMLKSITHHGLRKLSKKNSIVSATVTSGIVLNGCTGDQYLSIILGGNLYKNLYKENGLEPRLLSRTLEDSISVTSVLIPWNSCGMTQATVLGVATLTYLPYCVFNYLCPIMSIVMAVTGYKIYNTTLGHHWKALVS